MRTIHTTWQCRDYDVWGNAEDGYEVNDVIRQWDVDLDLQVELANEGTPQEFEHAFPTDEQLREVFDILPHVEIETDGDDMSIYVKSAKDWYPLGEMHCTSHTSLSPVSPS